MRDIVREWMGSLLRRWRARRHRDRLESDVRDEMAFHLAMREEQMRAAGATNPATGARLRFGNVDRVRDELRETWAFMPVAGRLAHDIRVAARTLRAAPVFTAVVIATLALGMGVNTAFFSVVNAALIRPFGFADPERLVSVYESFAGVQIPRLPFSAGDFEDLRLEQQSFEAVAAYRNVPIELGGEGPPQQVTGAKVSADLFRVLGVRAAIGRTFDADDDRPGRHVALLSWSLWQRLYAGDRSAVGRSIHVDRQPFVVVGVMPAGFVFPRNAPIVGPMVSAPADVWIPMAFTAGELTARANNHIHSVIARLRDGVSADAAQGEMDALGRRIAERYPPGMAEEVEFGLVVRPFREDISGTLERPLFLLLAAVGLVLLVACANVANLVLSRSIGRGREFAVRVALGAGRGVLIRLLLCEAALLCIASGAVGVALAYTVIHAAPALLVQAVPNLHSLSIDWRVLAFTAALAAGTTLIVGLVPLAAFARHDPGDVLRGGTSRATAGPGRLRLQRGFVVLTVGIACVLLVASGLFTRSLGRLVRADVHFEPEQVLTVAMTLPGTAYRSAASVRAFYGALERELGAVPGVRSVALTTDLPLTNYDLTVFTPEQGGPSDLSERMMYISYVSGPYFEALRIPRLGGRFFEPVEHERDRGVVVVNEKLAERAWPGVSAVGRRLKLTDANGAAPWLTVVGVVKNVADGPAGTDPGMHAWVPIRQMSDATLDTVTHQYGRDLKLVILAEGDLQTLAGTVRRRIAALDPQLALERVAPMADRIGDAFRQRRAGTLVVAAFAGLALLLASVGLYGVLAFMTAERRREIAVRIAMGATGREVVRLVLRQTAILVGIGLAIGLPASAGTARIIVALLYQPESFDFRTFATVAAVLTGVALIACAVPAWRATRFDPATVLRTE